MPQTPQDPKDLAKPTPAPVPDPPKADDDELSDEELGKVSGGMVNVDGGLRPRTGGSLV